MRNQSDNSKREIKESIHELIKAATRLSLAIESNSEDSSDNSTDSDVKREVTKPPPVQSSKRNKVPTSKPPQVRSSQHSRQSKVPTQKPRKLSNSVPESLGPYALGERLIITNNYLRARGTEGIVLSSKRRYTVIQDDEGNLHTRAHSNYNRVVN